MRQLCFVFAAFLALGCTKVSMKEVQKGPFWIYTSLPQSVVDDMEKTLAAKFSGANIKWHRDGGREIASKIESELSQGITRADLVMTSDPYWFLKLKKADLLMSYHSKATKDVPRKFLDLHSTFTAVRLPVLVLAYHGEVIKEGEAPKSWDALLSSRWKGKVSLANPIESETAFSAVAQLSRSKGWAFFEKLKKNGLLSAGQESDVISRMESKERPVGIVSLDRVLEAQQRGSALKVVYPTDGTMLVPSPIGIVKTTQHPELAKKVYDFFFGTEMQEANVAGRMYSPYTRVRTPKGARDLTLVLATSMEWSPAVLDGIQQQRETILKRFSNIVLN